MDMSEGQAVQRLEPFFPADTLADDNFPPADQADHRTGMLFPLLLSVLAHGVLLLAFIMFATRPPLLVEPVRKSVQINIIPGTAPGTTAAEATTSAIVQAELVEVTDQASIDQLPAAETAVNRPDTEAARVETPVSTESTAAANDEALPTPMPVMIIDAEIADRTSVLERETETAERTILQLPSTSGLRQLLKEISSADDKTMSLDDCNRLQQENELISCEATDNKELRPVDRNFVYEYFNPRRESRRSSASVNIIAAQTPAVAQRMRTAGVNAALSDFLLHNQTMSNEDYRGSAPRPEQRLTDVLNMGDRTYQMIKRTMGEQ